MKDNRTCNMRTSFLNPYRMALASAAVFLYVAIPFFKIGGHSALRFDIPQLRLYFFGGSLWIDEFFIVLAAVLSLTFLFIWITLVFGRIWCGWLCPQSILVDLSRWFSRGHAIGFHLAAAVLSVSVGAASVWYFVPPVDFMARLSSMSLGAVEGWSFLVLSLLLWLDTVMLGRVFCTTACPYAMLQSVMFDHDTMALAYDSARSDECMGCDACVRACPVGIDLREGLQHACFSCALCRDACAGKLAQKEKPGLILHLFGGLGGRLRLLRPASIALFAATVASAALFVTLVADRKDVDVLVLPNRDFSQRITRDGAAVASLILSFSNRRDVEAELYLSVAGGVLYPESVVLGPGEHKRTQVVVIMDRPKDTVLLDIENAEGKSIFSAQVRVPKFKEMK